MVKLFCGHSVENIYDSHVVAIKDEVYDHYEHKAIPAISHTEICSKCYDKYLSRDMLLLTREDEENYLLGNL